MVPLEAERRADLEDIAMGTGDADQDIAVAEYIHDAGCGVPVRFLRLSVAHEFDADVKSLSPHVADTLEALRDAIQLRQKIGADFERILLQFSASSVSNTASPAAAATGFPPNVLK